MDHTDGTFHYRETKNLSIQLFPLKVLMFPQFLLHFGFFEKTWEEMSQENEKGIT